MTQQVPKLLFVGAGKIAQSIMRGIIKAEPNSAEQILATAPSSRNLQIIESELGCQTILLKDLSKDRLRKFAPAFAFLCVKPQVLATIYSSPESSSELLGRLFKSLPSDCLTLSLVAGFESHKLVKYLRLDQEFRHRIIRVMLNTAAEIGSTSVLYSNSSELSDETKLQTLSKLFSLISQSVVKLPDDRLMDTATGVCGSGIAFFYEMIQAFSDVAVKNGLPRADALMVAAQLSKAAGKMVLEKKTHPYQLRDEVTSPAGTTIYGLDKWHENATNRKIVEAVQASIDRAKSLSN